MSPITANFYVWCDVLAWAAVIGVAFYYLQSSSNLSAFIKHGAPQLWDRINLPGVARGKGYGLLMLVFWDIGAQYHPDDPVFRRLLTETRWCCVMLLISFLAALILLGEAAPRSPSA
jgi:hypothetical protein